MEAKCIEKQVPSPIPNIIDVGMNWDYTGMYNGKLKTGTSKVLKIYEEQFEYNGKIIRTENCIKAKLENGYIELIGWRAKTGDFIQSPLIK